MAKKEFKDLSGTEKEIIELLWSSEKVLCFADILGFFNEEKGECGKNKPVRFYPKNDRKGNDSLRKEWNNCPLSTYYERKRVRETQSKVYAEPNV